MSGCGSTEAPAGSDDSEAICARRDRSASDGAGSGSPYEPSASMMFPAAERTYHSAPKALMPSPLVCRARVSP